MPSPLLQALLIADHVYQDRGTGKWIVCGIFDHYSIRKTQAKAAAEGAPILLRASEVQNAGTPFAYISVTELHHSKSFVLRLVDLSENTVVFEATFHVTTTDPTVPAKLAIPLPSLPHMPGRYALELLCENDLIGSYRIQCTELTPSGDES